MLLNNLHSLPFEGAAVSGVSVGIWGYWETEELASLSLLPGKFGNLLFQQPATSGRKYKVKSQAHLSVLVFPERRERADLRSRAEKANPSLCKILFPSLLKSAIITMLVRIRARVSALPT